MLSVNNRSWSMFDEIEVGSLNLVNLILLELNVFLTVLGLDEIGC